MGTCVEKPEQNPSLTTQALVLECIVCFQPYDHELNVPRVLSCGHTFCEPCLHELHTTWQSSTNKGGEDAQSAGVIRCPECNHRTRLPSGGQKSLPKNVALLRLRPTSSDSVPVKKEIQKLNSGRSRKSDGRAKCVDVRSRNSQRRSSGDRKTKLEPVCYSASSTINSGVASILENSSFCSSSRLDPGNWDIRAWILPYEVIHLKEDFLATSDCRLLYGEIVQEQGWARSRISVSLLPIEVRKTEEFKTLRSDVGWSKDKKSLEAECSKNKEATYEQLLLNVAESVDYETKVEISVLFRVSSICHRICKTFGLWMNENQQLYLVSECPESGDSSSWDVYKTCSTRSQSGDGSPRNSDAESLAEESLGKSTGRAELEVLTSLGVGLCELLLEVHAQGLVLGLLSIECIVFDQFENMLLDTNAALVTRHLLQKSTSSRKRFTTNFKAERQNLVLEDIPISAGEKSESAQPMSAADSFQADPQRNTRHGGKCWEYMSPEVLALLTSKMICSEDEYDSDGPSCCGNVSDDDFRSCEDEEAAISCKADVWSLGCIILELMTGMSPHAGSDFNEVLRSVLDEEGKPKFFQGLGFLEHGCDTCSCLDLDHHILQNLLQRCFEHDPHERPDVCELIQGFKELQLSNLAYKGKFRINTKNKVKTVYQKEWILCLPGFGLDGWFEYGRKMQTQKQESQKALEILKHGSEAERAKVSGEAGTLQGEGEEAHGESELLEACFVELKGSLEGHRDDVTALIVCGNYLLTASFDKTVRVWSLESHQLLRTLEGQHTQVILALAMDLDSMTCFSGDQLGHICSWCLEEGAETPLLASWQEHSDWRYTGVASLAVSGDGILYSGSGDRTIKAWSSQSFELRGTMEGHKALVSALVIDGELLYSGSWDGAIRVWWRYDHSPMALLSTSAPMMGGVRSLCLSEGMLFVGREDGSIQVWMDEEYIATVTAHKMVVSSLCVEGPFLYSGSWDQCIKVWRVEEMTSSSAPALEEKCGSGVSGLASDGSNLFVALMNAVKVYSIFSAGSSSSNFSESTEQQQSDCRIKDHRAQKIQEVLVQHTPIRSYTGTSWQNLHTIWRLRDVGHCEGRSLDDSSEAQTESDSHSCL